MIDSVRIQTIILAAIAGVIAYFIISINNILLLFIIQSDFKLLEHCQKV